LKHAFSRGPTCASVANEWNTSRRSGDQANCTRQSKEAARAGGWYPGEADRGQARKLIEDATVDAYDESEQRLGFYTMMENELALPFATLVLGVAVTVARVDLTEADEIVTICARGRTRQAISIVELPLPVPPPRGAEWIEAYRRWRR
jgi:hypothetical protein